jgi:hypothetical protein
MKQQTLRQKYMGADWYFVPDVQMPRTSRYGGERLETIDERFKNMCIDSGKQSDDMNRRRSENVIGKAILSQEIEKKSASVKKFKYRSPWYIPAKHWQKLAEIPEVNKDYMENRAKNLYYFLHKSPPNVNPLRQKDGETNQYEMRYSEGQNMLARLPSVQDYKK